MTQDERNRTSSSTFLTKSLAFFAVVRQERKWDYRTPGFPPFHRFVAPTSISGRVRTVPAVSAYAHKRAGEPLHCAVAVQTQKGSFQKVHKEKWPLTRFQSAFFSLSFELRDTLSPLEGAEPEKNWTRNCREALGNPLDRKSPKCHYHPKSLRTGRV